METFASTSARSGNKVICFGCGQALYQSSQRRNLTGAASSHVIPLWKAVLESQFERRGTAIPVAMVVQDVIERKRAGCFYIEYADAIREGDGDRVLRCWRYLLPIFKSSGRTNYSIEALTFLQQQQYLLTPRQSAELVWNRFINVHGVRGRNIPCDLHLEHLNRVCKNAISDLGVNKTEKAIKRVGNVLGTLYPALQQFDSDNHIRDTSGTHHMPTSEKDRDRIIHELQQTNVFSSIPNRTHHQSFPNPRHVLHHSDHETLHQWIMEHI